MFNIEVVIQSNDILSSGPESSCLDDKPGQTVHEPEIFKIKLPGQVYDGDEQCRKAYGKTFRRCRKLFVSSKHFD